MPISVEILYFSVLTKTTAVQNEVMLSYHSVRGLSLRAVVFAATTYDNSPFIWYRNLHCHVTACFIFNCNIAPYKYHERKLGYQPYLCCHSLNQMHLCYAGL